MALVERLRPRAIIMEEAAELLEGQFLACLPGSVEHVVMFGARGQPLSFIHLPPIYNSVGWAVPFSTTTSCAPL